MFSSSNLIRKRKCDDDGLGFRVSAQGKTRHQMHTIFLTLMKLVVPCGSIFHLGIGIWTGWTNFVQHDGKFHAKTQFSFRNRVRFDTTPRLWFDTTTPRCLKYFAKYNMNKHGLLIQSYIVRDHFESLAVSNNTTRGSNSHRLNEKLHNDGCRLSLIHIWRCRRIERCRSRWSPYH